jgi:hydrogenase maturation protein HypF
MTPAGTATPGRRPARRVLALGAWLKNTAALLTRDGGGRVVLHRSPLHGDLGTPDACIALAASADALCRRAGGPIDAVAPDLHPDCPSRGLALALAARVGVPAIAVQHHHAHAAVVAALDAAETRGMSPGQPCVALALDGTGLGCDGTAWGGEVLVVSGAQFHRVAHLVPLRMPGADRAAVEPWRMAAAGLHAIGRPDAIEPAFAPWVGAALAGGVRRLLASGRHAPPTTAAGRWFDAAAGLLGLHARRQTEAAAAVALEHLAAAAGDLDAVLAREPLRACLAPAAAVGAASTVVDLRPTLHRLAALCGVLDGAAAGTADDAIRRTCAALFHRDLADALALAAVQAAHDAGSTAVVLSGGCIANRVLRTRLTERLRIHGLSVQQPPPADWGDAGLAVGQAWVALERLDAGDAIARPQGPAVAHPPPAPASPHPNAHRVLAEPPACV